MIVHVVLFEPRPDLSQTDRRHFFEELRTAATTIPSVRRFQVGRRVRHGLPGYEQVMRDDYTYAALVEFDDRAGLEAYLTHPAHETVGTRFGTAALRALAYDYEMSGAAETDAAHLVPRP